MKSYVNLSCDNPTTDDHSLYLSMMCLHLNGFVLESMSVESIFSLDLSEGGWGKELRIPDCLLLRSRVPVNGKGMF